MKDLITILIMLLLIVLVVVIKPSSKNSSFNQEDVIIACTQEMRMSVLNDKNQLETFGILINMTKDKWLEKRIAEDSNIIGYRMTRTREYIKNGWCEKNWEGWLKGKGNDVLYLDEREEIKK